MLHNLHGGIVCFHRRAIAAGYVATIAMVAGCGGGGGGYSGGSASSNSSSSSSALSSPSSGFGVSVAFAQLPAFTHPLFALQAPSDNSRWFVLEQAGRVRVFDNAANVSSAGTYLDLTSKVTSGGETGLLGMAFHPNFPADPRVFVSYTTTISGQLTSRIASFVTHDQGLTLDASSEQILLTVTQPEDNHNGGNIVFGPDGLLYIGFGDGGGEGDQHGAFGNGQNLNTLLGKLLRIDVGGPAATGYTIPADNPYYGNASCGPNGGGQPCPEIYAYGFRNPWRFSFDAQTGELWLADVGQAAWEEIDVVSKGGNYGWRCYEGSHQYDLTGCSANNYRNPIWEYDHSGGDDSITGGYVYRGSLTPAMQGKYIYGDFVSGRIWALSPPSGSQAAQNTLLADSNYGIASFAKGNDGELYLLDWSGGTLIKLAF